MGINIELHLKPKFAVLPERVTMGETSTPEGGFLPPIFDAFNCNATDVDGQFLPEVSCFLRFVVEDSISVPEIPAVFDQMGTNLEGIFVVNVVIMGAIFVGAMVLSIDTMWTRKKEKKSAV